MIPFEYSQKGQKEKRWGVDVETLLSDMDNLERFNGTTKEKTVDNYYSIKKQLLAVLQQEPEEEEKPQPPKKESVSHTSNTVQI